MLASRVRWDRWTKISLALVSLAVIAAFAMKPAQTRGRVVVVDTTVEILDDVTFVGDTISTRSLRTLDAVAATLDGNPNIQLVEVQATTEPRARVVVDYLVGQGIAPERLQTGVNEGPRAAFLILKRASE